MIAAVYLVSLTETSSGGTSSSSGEHGDAAHARPAILLHRRYCPSANAAGSVAVVDKFFGVARALTAEALASSSSSSSAGGGGGGGGASSNGADTKLDSDRADSQSNRGSWNDTSATNLSSWSLKVLPPVVETDAAYVVFRRISDGVLLLASCQVETPPVMLVEFLKVFHDTLAFYVGADKLTNISLPTTASFGASPAVGGKLSLGNVTSVVSSIANRDSGAASAQLVVLAAQLLDEMVDGGFPVQTELSILKSLIAPPTIMNRVASAVTGQNYSVSDALPELADNNIPWRRTNVKYASNEIYFDIEEQIDAVFDPAGMLVTCDVHGIVNVNSKLSGFPDLLATLTVRRTRVHTFLLTSNRNM